LGLEVWFGLGFWQSFAKDRFLREPLEKTQTKPNFQTRRRFYPYAQTHGHKKSILQ
jgi:hypothetical protein